MTGRIRVLDGALVDQIAAGEVVERPASVVKELLENALDAGAGAVTIEVEGGGVERIRVTDDGEGMEADDASRALVRHATSKIRSAEDLQVVRTLGFRGEALPSIASVARLTLTTRPREALEGTRVRVDGGSAPQVDTVGCAPGTTVEVEALFANVPARRKFLKSRATENAHITEACLQVALAHPTLRLLLLREGRRAREFLPCGDVAERAQGALGTGSLREVIAERDGVRVRAVLAPPEKARTGTAGLHVFVNGRPVRERSLARAVAFAYGSVIPPGRYPVGVVHLEVDPAEVDVNVHPQKAEVRFSRGRAVNDAITRMLASELGTTAWSGPAGRGTAFWDQRLGGTGPSPAQATETDTPSATPTDPQAPPPPADASGAEDPWGLSGVLRDGRAQPDAAPSLQAAPAQAPPAASEGGLVESRGFFGSLRALGQARKMWIVCEGPDGLYVVDQHAADERVRYDRLKRAHGERRVATQRLLFPERVECSAAEAALVEDQGEAIAALGLECAVLGPTTVAVHTVPRLVDRAPPERLLRDVLDEMGHRGERAFGDAVDMALATMACHGSIRGGDVLSPEECAALLRAMDEVTDFGSHCPHGRPVVFSLSFGDLERRLGR